MPSTWAASAIVHPRKYRSFTNLALRGALFIGRPPGTPPAAGDGPDLARSGPGTVRHGGGCDQHNYRARTSKVPTRSEAPEPRPPEFRSPFSRGGTKSIARSRLCEDRGRQVAHSHLGLPHIGLIGFLPRFVQPHDALGGL